MNSQYSRGQAFRIWLLILAGALGIGRIGRAQTFHSGPFRMDVGVQGGFEYTDNVNLSENHPKSDVLMNLGPYINGGLDVPVLFAGGQRFTLSASASYTKSLTGNREDSFGAPVIASLVIPMHFAHWQMVLSDAFNFRNDPLETTFGYNVGVIDQYNNVAAFTMNRPFGRISLSFDASRTDVIVPDLTVLEETDYSFSETISYALRQNYSVFWRNTYGLVYPADSARQKTIGFSTEVGLNGQFTPSVSGSASVGWSHSDLLANQTQKADSFDGISSTLALNYTHPLRPNTSHTISVSRSPGVTAVLKDSNITEMTSVTYCITHQLSKFLTLAPTVSWTHVRSLSSIADVQKETADIIATGLTLSRSFGRHLSSYLTYEFQTRSSNLNEASYDVNRVIFNTSYTF